MSEDILLTKVKMLDTLSSELNPLKELGMSNIEVVCSLIKNEGKVIGLSLVAEFQTEAEMFCSALIRQIINSKEGISRGDDKICFFLIKYGRHPTITEQVEFQIDDKDASDLFEAIGPTKDVGLYKDGMLAPGFKMVPVGMENTGEKFELKRL